MDGGARKDDTAGSSAELMRFAFERSAEGFFEWRPTTSHMYCSPRYCEILGLASQEQSPSLEFWQTIIHPDDLSQVADLVLGVANGEGESFETEFRARGRSEKWLRVVCRGIVVEREADGRPSRVMGTLADMTEQRAAENALRKSEERYRMLVEHQGEGIGIVDASERFIFANPAAENIFGVAEGAMIGRSLEDFVDTEAFARILGETARRKKGERSTYEVDIRRPDGSERSLLITATPKYDREGQYEGALGIFRDITDRVRAEERRRVLEGELRRAQRLESIGRLAGGIAHDFNNLLTPILVLSQMMRGELSPDHPMAEDLQTIALAAERARDLVQQLLAVGRKQLLRVQVLDINRVIVDAHAMLRRLIREDVAIDLALDDDAGFVKADVSQIQQILLNLALNARDSMEGGGTMTIRTARRTVDVGDRELTGQVEPGKYVLIEVSDDGCGMDAEIAARVFEPFFSTKSLDKGAGLGLATVHGIVKQHGGHISLESAPRRGTRFSIFLPRADGEIDYRSSEHLVVSPKPADATVLVVEDDDPVRRLACKLFGRRGFTVLEARDGDEALLVADRYRGPIHLLLTDVVMPRLDGYELARRLVCNRPDVAIVYMSGYTNDTIARHEILDQDILLVEKPFTERTLMSKVDEALQTIRVDPVAATPSRSTDAGEEERCGNPPQPVE